MREMLCVGLGGFLGANARYLLAGWAADRFGVTFPYGTFTINISGSFILGLILGGLEARTLSPLFRLTTAVGFLGAYTTFSTFTYETMRLIEEGDLLLAAINAGGSLVVGVGATLLGLLAGRAL